MDYAQETAMHKRKAREIEKAREKEREDEQDREEARNGSVPKHYWIYGLGFVLVIVAVVIWSILL